MLNLFVFPLVKKVHKYHSKKVNLFLIYNILYNAVYTAIYLQTVICRIHMLLFGPISKTQHQTFGPSSTSLRIVIEFAYLMSVFPTFNLIESTHRCGSLSKTNFFSPIRCKIHEALLNDKVVWPRGEAGSVGLQFEKKRLEEKWTWSANIVALCCYGSSSSMQFPPRSAPVSWWIAVAAICSPILIHCLIYD